MTRVVVHEFGEDPGHWDLQRRLELSARGSLCGHCKQAQMRPSIYVELRTLVQNGQLTREEMVEACAGYCLGHADEWIPDYIIQEERQP